ncbi:heparin lyase I family protein [Paraflavisolibacter sp. H34]|uniref:heparin lyase I family protein n=1 Tax=Huijunlia imazamoxiresistens TaxID=3127457 RepID=UPI00301A9C5E
MKKAAFSFLLLLLLALETRAQAGFQTITRLNAVPISSGNGGPPQARVWTHAGLWWSVLPTQAGPRVYRLNGQTLAWEPQSLNLGTNTDISADCRVKGDSVYVLLYRGANQNAQVYLLKFTGTTYTVQGQSASLKMPSGSKTATLALEANGRLWLATDTKNSVQLWWSDPSSAGYTRWNGPWTAASGLTDDDIGALVPLPPPAGSQQGPIGLMWSNGKSKRLGFKTHSPGTDPTAWSPEEVPAGPSGMGAAFLDVKTGADGTLYCATQTSVSSTGSPRVLLLVRRPGGAWASYPVTTYPEGDQPLVLLQEAQGKIKVAYTSASGTGGIVSKESPLAAISFGPAQTLLGGRTFNFATTTHQAYGSRVVLLATQTPASGSRTAEGVLAEDLSDDKTAPVVQRLDFISAQPGTNGNGGTLTYGLAFSEPVSGVDAADIAVRTVSGTVSSSGTAVTPTGIPGDRTAQTYTITVNIASGSGTVAVDLKEGGTGIEDRAGNFLSGGFAGTPYTIAPYLPVVRLSSDNTTHTSYAREGNQVLLQFTASEPLSPEVTLAQAPVAVTAGSGNSFTAAYQVGTDEPEGRVPVSITFRSGDGGTQETVVTATTDGSFVAVDRTPPGVLASEPAQPVLESPTQTQMVFRVTFREGITGLDKTDFIPYVTGTVAGTVTAAAPAAGIFNGTAYAITVSNITGEGTLRLDLKESGTQITDSAGNDIAGGFTGGQVLNVQPPVVTPPNILYSEGFEDGKGFENEPAKGIDGFNLQVATSYGFTVVGQPTYQDAQVGRWELRDSDPMTSGGTRAEVLFPDQFRLAETWHSYVSYFPAGQYLPDSDDETFNQWHQGGDFGSPMFTLRTMKGSIQVRRRTPDGANYTDHILMSIPYDRWVAFVMHMKQHVTNGIFQVWIDGELKMDYKGPTMYAGPYGKWKIGIYKSDWNKGGTTDTHIRVWYIDEVKLGDSTAVYQVMRPQGNNITRLQRPAARAGQLTEEAVPGRQADLRVWPTLAKKGTAIALRTPDGVPSEGVMVNAAGQVLHRFRFTGTATVETSPFPAGVYFIQVSGRNGTLRQKIFLTD